MRRILLRVILLIVVLTWLAGAAVMLFVQPDARPSTPLDITIDTTPVGRVLGYDGYTCSSSVGVGPDGDDPRIDYTVVRGPLDRAHATFPISVGYATNNRTPLRRIQLAVSTFSRADLADAEAWTWIGTAKARAAGDGHVAVIAEARAPADANTGMFRIEETLTDGSTWSLAGTMPQAPTLLGRVHDTIGHWPLFSWIPSLR